MKISIDKRIILLYVILFFAIFNDTLRIGNTDITLFRIAMIPGWIICIKFDYKKVIKWIIVFVAVMFINTLQSILFFETNTYQIKFDMMHYLTYTYFAACIISVICFTSIIYAVNKEFFAKQFKDFLEFNSYILLAIYVLLAIAQISGTITVPFNVSNVNNYGAYFNAILPFFIIRILRYKDMKSIIFCFVVCVTMLIHDCKLCILGVAVEILLLVVLEVYRRKRLHLKRALLSFIIIVVCCIAVLFMCNIITLNGNGFIELISEPLSHIFNGTVYPSSKNSIHYRVNMMVVGIRFLFETWCIGIGYGNAGLAMRYVLGNYEMKDKLYSYNYIALHNAPLEFCIEFGFLALLFYGKVIISVLKSIISRDLSDYKIIYATIVISLPVWLLAPSVITTTYFLYIVVTYLYISINEKNEKHFMDMPI